jgi:hypothetical protein
MNAARGAAKTKREAKEVKLARKGFEKVRTRDSLQALSKLGELVDGRYRIVSQPPLVVPLRDLQATYGLSPAQVERAVRQQFRGYRATLDDARLGAGGPPAKEPLPAPWRARGPWPADDAGGK